MPLVPGYGGLSASRRGSGSAAENAISRAQRPGNCSALLGFIALFVGITFIMIELLGTKKKKSPYLIVAPICIILGVAFMVLGFWHKHVMRRRMKARLRRERAASLQEIVTSIILPSGQGRKGSIKRGSLEDGVVLGLDKALPGEVIHEDFRKELEEERDKLSKGKVSPRL